MDELDEINVSAVDKVVEFFKSRLRVQGRTPCIYIVCVGASVATEHLPAPLSQYLAGDLSGGQFPSGVYLPEYQAALLQFGCRTRISNVVYHELAHALLILLTGGFRFALAIEEGYAGFIEHGFLNGNRRLAPAQGYWKPDDLLTVKELLQNCTWKKAEDPEGHRKRTFLSYWLNVYLSRISEQRREMRTRLRTLWMKQLRNPQDVYAWLLEASAMSAEEFEDGFATFCTTGRHPLASQPP